MAYMIS